MLAKATAWPDSFPWGITLWWIVGLPTELAFSITGVEANQPLVHGLHLLA